MGERRTSPANTAGDAVARFLTVMTLLLTVEWPGNAGGSRRTTAPAADAQEVPAI